MVRTPFVPTSLSLADDEVLLTADSLVQMAPTLPTTTTTQTPTLPQEL